MTELNTALTVQLGAVVTAIDEQSPDIAQGVNDGYENRDKAVMTTKIQQVPATRV